MELDAVLDMSALSPLEASEVDSDFPDNSARDLLDISVNEAAFAAGVAVASTPVAPRVAGNSPLGVAPPPERSHPSRRLLTEQEKAAADLRKHPMLAGCGPCKRKKCDDKFTLEARKEIHDAYWMKSYERRQQWLTACVHSEEKKTSTTSSTSERENSLTWSFCGVEVCKTFFLRTLGYSHDNVVQGALRKLRAAQSEHGHPFPAADDRGRTAPGNKIPESVVQEIRQHINSYRPQPSHYRLFHAPNRRYLPQQLSIRQIFRDYNDKEGSVQVSWGSFHTIFSRENISFTPPSADECDACELHQTAHPGQETAVCESECCLNFDEHVRNLKLARALYKHWKDCKDPGTAVYAVDMQKEILMPKLEVKEYYFKRKLILFNETFAHVGGGHPDDHSWVVLWTENEAGRKSFNVASAYFNFVQTICDGQMKIEHLVLFADNCSSQNKNYTLVEALIRIMNDPHVHAPDKLTLIFLEKGHTFMAADSIHGSIGKRLSGLQRIGDLQDFTHQILSSRKKLRTILLKHDQMILFDDTCMRKGAEFKVSQVRMIEVRKKSRSIFFKNDFTDEMKEFPIAKRTSNPFTIPSQTMRKARGIPLAKKTDLVWCSQFLPFPERKFFLDLQVNDESTDLEVTLEDD